MDWKGTTTGSRGEIATGRSEEVLKGKRVQHCLSFFFRSAKGVLDLHEIGAHSVPQTRSGRESLRC